MQSAHEILVQIYVCFNACLRLRMHACMCACCLHVCMMLACVHMLVLVHFPCMLSPVQKCFQMCMPASMHPFVCAWMFAWMDVCKHGCVQTWMWANMDVCKHGCVHGWMCAWMDVCRHMGHMCRHGRPQSSIPGPHLKCDTWGNTYYALLVAL